LGTVGAKHEKAALAEAAKQFNISPAQRNKLTVVKLEEWKVKK
jgi:hypothetical protein